MHVVSVAVTQRIAGGRTQRVEDVRTPSLGDIDNALKQEVRLAKVAVKEAHPTTFAKQAATLTLTLATPHAVVDVIIERVDKTITCDGTRDTDSLRDDDAHAVTREEGLCWILATLTVGHPFGTHTYLPSFYVYHYFYSHSSDLARHHLPAFVRLFTRNSRLIRPLEVV
jgi:hypothetical protein